MLTQLLKLKFLAVGLPPQLRCRHLQLCTTHLILLVMRGSLLPLRGIALIHLQLCIIPITLMIMRGSLLPITRVALLRLQL